MLISILLPAYNAADYLQSCLESILNQTESNWELLAIDDFSTDNSWSILQTYAQKDSRIKIFRNQEKGIIPALRLAFQESEGDLITRMDADDMMSEGKLKNLKAVLSRAGKGHIATGLVEYFSAQSLGAGYQSYAEWLNQLTTKNQNFEEIYKECVIPSPCWMVHRSDLLACGAFQSNRYPEDYDLCFRFYEQQLKVLGVQKILHHWRDYAARTSRTDATYADNRFLGLKMYYFLKLDYNKKKRLVLWGAGKKGKQIAAKLVEADTPFRWLCNRESKWGHRILGIELEDYRNLASIQHPQIIVAVAAKDAQKEIRSFLAKNAGAIEDFFFFC